jgi:hypothetical protein
MASKTGNQHTDSDAPQFRTGSYVEANRAIRYRTRTTAGAATVETRKIPRRQLRALQALVEQNQQDGDRKRRALWSR